MLIYIEKFYQFIPALWQISDSYTEKKKKYRRKLPHFALFALGKIILLLNWESSKCHYGLWILTKAEEWIKITHRGVNSCFVMKSQQSAVNLPGKI